MGVSESLAKQVISMEPLLEIAGALAPLTFVNYSSICRITV